MNSTLDYPINVLEEALNYFEGTPLSAKYPNGLNDKQINGIYFTINRLQPRYRDLIHKHYSNNESFVDIAKSMSVSKSRVYQLLHKAFSDILSEANYKYIRDGIDATFINGTNAIAIKDIGVSQRVSNALGRAGIFTIGDLICFFESHTMREFMSIRCLGNVNYAELHNALLEYDIDLDSYREDSVNEENK